MVRAVRYDLILLCRQFYIQVTITIYITTWHITCKSTRQFIKVNTWKGLFLTFWIACLTKIWWYMVNMVKSEWGSEGPKAEETYTQIHFFIFQIILLSSGPCMCAQWHTASLCTVTAEDSSELSDLPLDGTVQQHTASLHSGLLEPLQIFFYILW